MLRCCTFMAFDVYLSKGNIPCIILCALLKEVRWNVKVRHREWLAAARYTLPSFNDNKRRRTEMASVIFVSQDQGYAYYTSHRSLS